MKTFAVLYITTLLVFTMIDAVWLSVMTKRFYQVHIGHLITATPNWTAAVTFYLIYIFGIVFFVVYPAYMGNTPITTILLHGALLGIFAYATYDLTNQATIKDWPTIVTAVDLLWGAALTAVVSAIAVVVAKTMS
ncbi:MAG: DUF2177 family protein [Candidatus Moranbacteria bacterium]|nr:DUF2177 family protein [Candidatus Moranbacteria bacterium]